MFSVILLRRLRASKHYGCVDYRKHAGLALHGWSAGVLAFERMQAGEPGTDSVLFSISRNYGGNAGQSVISMTCVSLSYETPCKLLGGKCQCTTARVAPPGLHVGCSGMHRVSCRITYNTSAVRYRLIGPSPRGRLALFGTLVCVIRVLTLTSGLAYQLCANSRGQ